MSDLQRLVSVNISRQTKAVTQKGFGIGLILGEETEKPVGMSERTRTYLDLSGLGEDFSSTSEVYKAAQAYFGQSIKPENVVVGFIEGSESVSEAIDEIKNENSNFYAVGMIRKDQASQEALAAYIETDCRIAGVRTDDSNVLTVNNDVIQTEIIELQNSSDPDAGAFDLNIDGEIANINQAFDAQQIKDAIESLSNVPLNSVNVTGALATQDLRIEFTSSQNFSPNASVQNVTITDGGSPVTLNLVVIQEGSTANDDIAKVLSDLDRERTFVLYSSKSSMEYPEFAWMGKVLPKLPGSVTWMFKSLSGITPDVLSATSLVNLKNKNANYYHEFGGQNITENGVMASGEFIDVIRGVDFIQARMQEAIFSRLVNLDKIPYTNAGVDIIVNEMEAVLDRAVNVNQILSPDPAPVVNKPNVRDIPFNDRAQRCLPDINFEGVLAGAVHNVKITGNVTV